MNFESLANELLLNLFEYMTIVDLLNGFYDLNNRLNMLLYKQFHRFDMNCESMRKDVFDTICRNRLPYIIDRIRSIRLSDDEETPQQSEIFLSHGLSLNRFTCLQSLTLSHLRSVTSMEQLLLQCHHLSSISCLNFIDCSFRDGHQSVRQYLNNLWNLPSLKRCHMDIDFFNFVYKIVPSALSNTLQYLSIESYAYNGHELFQLMKMTPSIRYLSILIDDESLDSIVSFILPLLTRLNLIVYRSSKTLLSLLKSTPNLNHLTVTTDDVDMNGERWENLIINHLPRLCIFQLKMIFRFEENQGIDDRANELINTFRSSFWLTQRQWFVRCEWNRCDQCDKNNIHLYTLPYNFDAYFLHNAECTWISTRPSNQHSETSSYSHVRQLAFALDPSDIRLPSFFSFANLTHLDIEFPANNEHLHSTFPRLNHLKHLCVTKFQQDHPLFIPTQLQNLLDQMNHLYSITFQEWSSSSSSNEIPPFHYTNQSVRRLNLRNIDQYYNLEQCTKLMRSSLGNQCEVLSITVANRSNILDLIKHMQHLRSLNVICRDDPWKTDNNTQQSSIHDELIEWLHTHLASSTSISRSNEKLFDNYYQTWIPVRIWLN